MAASVERHQLTHLFQHFSSPSLQSDFSINNDVVNAYAYNEQDDENDDDEEGEPYWKDALSAAKAEAAAELLARPDPRDVNTPDSWVARDPSLIRLTGKHPFNSEPPVTKLMNYGFITPVPIHYVRNHGPVPRTDTWHNWTVEVGGLVRRPTTFTVSNLIKKFRSIEFPVTLVCAGNRRAEQNAVKQTAGFNWGPGAISTSVWRGVRLVDVLKFCGIRSRRAGAISVCFEGGENLPGGKFYGTSIRREVAMDPAREIILAYMQNGDQLTPDHGFPIRVIIPGFIGGRSVKWLKKIVVSMAESESYYHYKDNRVLPSHVDAELANDDAWWHKPEYIINELNINSVITTPYHGEIFPINSITTSNPFTIKGYAYSGGGKKVTRAEITLDGGETWRVCKVDHPEIPSKYGKYWCWCFWSVNVEAVDLLGAKEIAVRAWDESHNTQPEKLNWNIKGMMNNCWFKVKIAVCRPRSGEIGLVFEHPTQPANHSGGWMAREKHVETSNNELKKSASTPFMLAVTAEKRYSMSEIRRHSSKDSTWIVIHGNVYDCTEFLDDHPGGADSILLNAGGPDCTEEFEAIHSDKAKSMLEKYRIGVLAEEDSNSESSSVADTTAYKTVALSNPKERVECELIAKTLVSRDVRLFRFALPSPEQKLGLPVGKHVLLCAYIGGDVNKKLCMRAYTPTSPVDSTGYFDLLVRIYFKDENPNFPTGGLMSQLLESLPMNSTVEIKGPLGHIEYLGRGKFSVHGKPTFAKKLAMVAGGTGITPIYQVIQAVLNDYEDRTEMWVVYACRTEDDILLRDELDRWAAEHPQRLKVWYMVSSTRRPEWKYGVGRVNEGVLTEHLPLGGDETLALACGPPAMIDSAIRPNLEKLNYDIEKSFLVF